MATFEKRKLANDSSGTGIALGSSGTSIPCHYTETSSTILDEVWLYGSNTGSVAATITVSIFVNGQSETTKMQIELPPYSGMYLLIPGLVISGVNNPPPIGSAFTEVRATDNDSTDSVYVFGYVNRITP